MSSSVPYDAVKRKKNYYRTPAKRNKSVEVGLKGFLCSCNFKENVCVKEAYNILNEFVDKHFVVTEKPEEASTTTSNEIEDDLATELAEIKNNKNRYDRFQVVDSGAKNMLFIKTSLKNPVEIVSKIVEDIEMTKQQKTRYLLRIIPVETVSKANISDIVKALEPFLKIHFEEENKTYSIVYNHRNNDGLSRDNLISEVAKSVQEINSNSKVNLKDPEISVVIEIIRGFAFLSVIPNFTKYKKFNLISLSQNNFETAENKSENDEDGKQEN